MAGEAWGSREELLHPRDSHGRFRNTWKMATGAVDKLLGLLDKFNAKTFNDDQEAGNYVHSLARSDRTLSNRHASIDKFVRNASTVQKDLRAGKETPDSKAMDAAMRPLPEDLILSRVVGPEAFGLNPSTIGQTPELTGKLIKDKGFSPTNIGTPLPHEGPAITMVIATPAGTRAVTPSVGRPSREVILDREQPFRVTKVQDDGRGGFYVMAVAVPKEDQGNKRAVDINRAIVPQGGETQVPGEGNAPGGLQTPQISQDQVPGQVPGGAGSGVQPRNEGHVAENVGGAQIPGGKQTPGGGEGQVPGGETQGTGDVASFQEAFKKANLNAPSPGTRRKEWSDTYLGVASGKLTPEQAVQKLDNHIAVHEATVRADKLDGTDSGPLVEDIKRQRELSDLIKQHFGLEGAKKQEAPKKISDEEIHKQERARIAQHRRELRQQREAGKTVEQKKQEETARITQGQRNREIAAQEEAKRQAAIEAIGTRIGEKVPDNAMLRSFIGLTDDQVNAKKISRIEAARRVRSKAASDTPWVDKHRDFLNKLADHYQSGGKSTGIKKEIPGKLSHEDLGKQLRSAKTRDEARKLVDDQNMTVAELRQFTKDHNIPVSSKDNKESIKKSIVEVLAGHRIDSESLTRNSRGGKTETPKIPETPKTPEVPKETVKPQWGTLKTHGVKNGDIVMYHGNDRRKMNTEGQRARVEYGPSGYALVDPETGKRITAGGHASRIWASKVTQNKVSETKSLDEHKTAIRDIAKSFYQERKGKGNEWLSVTDLRKELDKKGIGREDQDKAFIALAKEPGVRLIPVANSKSLTEADRKAAVHFGGEDNHAISFQDLHRQSGGDTRSTSVRLKETKNRNEAEKILNEQVIVQGKPYERTPEDYHALIRGAGLNAAPEGIKNDPQKLRQYLLDGLHPTGTPKKSGIDAMTVAQLREEAKRQNVKIPANSKKADIVSYLKGEKEVPKGKRELARDNKVELEKVQLQKRQERDQKLLEAKQKREQEVAQRRQEREQKQLEAKQQREAAAAKKKEEAAQKKRDLEAARQQKITENLNNHEELTGPGYTVDILRNRAKERGLRIPSHIKNKEQLRQYIINDIKNNGTFDPKTLTGTSSNTFGRMLNIAKEEGIPIPIRISGHSDPNKLRDYILEQRATPAHQKVSIKNYSPQHNAIFENNNLRRHWFTQLTQDTEPNKPIRVHNINIENYHVEHGVIHRINGTSYLVETTGPNHSPEHIALVVSDFKSIHDSLPEADKYQKAYSWLRKANPDDAYWQKKFKNPNHISIANAGDQVVHVFGQRSQGDLPKQYEGSLKHEYGHNVDDIYGKNILGQRDVSSSTAWSDAALKDNAGNKNVKDFQEFGYWGHPIQVHEDHGRDYPYGVSQYGKSSSGEDFAEAVRQYFAGRLGRGTINGKMLDNVYFRDLFPHRAEILDKIFPELAKEQKATIARERRIP